MSPRLFLPATVLLVTALVPARADTFDHYTNPVLGRVPEAKAAKQIKRLTPELILDHDRALPRLRGAVLVVRTNEGRWAKLLVQSARRKANDGKLIPILYVERFVTYREGEERAIVAQGRRRLLFPGLRFSLDLGQIVPDQLGGDLRFIADGDKLYTEPLGAAKFYLLTGPLPDAAPKKGPKVVIGATFRPEYFNGTYKLHDDGRRSGLLKLSVDEDGAVTGSYYSDRDGRKYDVTGKVGRPPQSIRFQIKFPRSVQTFQGLMFTGDGKAITGTSQLARHEAGFYAVRVEEK